MLKRLHLRNFTVFADAEFEFGEGLNVLVGANGTGKTHVLKAGYVVEAVRSAIKSEKLERGEAELINKFADEKYPEWGIRLVFYLADTFSVKGLSNLVRRGIPEGKSLVNTEFGPSLLEHVSFEFGKLDDTGNFDVTEGFLTKDNNLPPVFIPAKEALTLGWMIALYERYMLPVDRTYPDLLRLLSGPSLRQPKPAHIVRKLSQLIGGKVEEEGGVFYLSAEDQPRLEMNLVAEGMRKFATLYKLLANGTLTPETTLFWDEPEANLNPALLKDMASILTDLAQAGFQIILATHSLFLLKELHILAHNGKAPVRYFGLSAQSGEAVTVATADNLELLPDIVALDAELEQTDRFQRVLNQEDANRN